MTLLLDKDIKQFQSIDPILDVNKQRGFVVKKGAASVVYKPEITNNISNNQVTWNITPPSGNTVMSRRLVMKIPFQITFTGLDQGTPLLQLKSGVFALRCLPLSSIISNASFSLNGTSFSYIMNETIHELMRYNVDQEESFLAGTGLLQQDNWETYAAAAGANNNPLNNYASGTFRDLPRGAYNDNFTIISNTNTGAVIQFDLIEELYISPCQFSLSESSGFVYLNKLDIVLQFGDLTRMISSSTGANSYTSVTPIVNGNIATMYVEYLTPQLNTSIPKEVPYSYEQVRQYPSPVGVINAGADFSINSNNIQLGVIPDAILIFAKKTLNTLTYQDSDVNAYLKNITITFGNKAGLLSSAEPYQLYQIAKKNGLNSVSWDMWRKHCGSVLLLKPDQDLSLSALEAPSLSGFNGNLYIQCLFNNIFPVATNFTLYIVTITSGVITLNSSQSVIQQVDVLTPQDVLDSDRLPQIPYDNINDKYGAGLLDTIKDVVKFFKDNKIVSTVGKALSNIPGPVGAVAGTIGTAADAVGFGGQAMSKSKLAKALRKR